MISQLVGFMKDSYMCKMTLAGPFTIIDPHPLSSVRHCLCMHANMVHMYMFTAALFFTKIMNFGMSTGLSRGKKPRMFKKWRQS